MSLVETFCIPHPLGKLSHQQSMSLFLGMNAIAGDMNARSAGSECLASLELTPAGGKRRYQRNKLWSTWQGNKTILSKIFKNTENYQISRGIPATEKKHMMPSKIMTNPKFHEAQRIESSWMFHVKSGAEAQSHAAKELPVTQPKAFLPHLPKNR